MPVGTICPKPCSTRVNFVETDREADGSEGDRKPARYTSLGRCWQGAMQAAASASWRFLSAC
jgi:hypothetical protein